MAYRIAHSLDVLRDQINTAFPDRSKASDGWIGDARHRSRGSDHNPWVRIKENGRNIDIVTALDITHDPHNGVDARKLAEALIKSRDPRIKYIISNREILAGNDGPKPWQWRRYSGVNPHTKHVHISVEDKQKLFDNDSAWSIAQGFIKPAPPNPQTRPNLRKGSKGEHVRYLQTRLNAHGSTLKVDGDFGNITDRAVRLFQRTNGLHPDGIVGPYTWERLEQ